MHAWFIWPKAARAATSRFVAAALFALLFCAGGAGASAAGAGFGAPPSGEIPILFNDHTVYAKPDILKRSRVLAALVKGGQIYVPLRSMFEEMGANVSASGDGKTITAAKSGSMVSVTLGKPEVVINGETRPLDVPPMLYRGIVLVPVRVISEALGAYVQWLPARHVVVVRYIPAAPPIAPPTPAPTAAPTATPTLAPIVPTAAPTALPQRSYQGFIQGAFAARKNFNEFSAGEYCRESYTLAAAYALKNSPIAVKVDFRQDAYVTSDNLTDAFNNHYTQFATIDGGTARTPVFLARQSSLDARLEFAVAAPRVYVGLGYLHTATNYGYPHLNAVGVGIEKLPDLRPGVNFFGSGFYYPNATGNYTVSDAASSNLGRTYRQQYVIVKYDIGLSLVSAHSPLYVYGGFNGDHYIVKQNAPIGQTHDGPYIGLGVKL